MAFGSYYEGIKLFIPQVCYTTITLFCLSALATFLALSRPSGPQPATFGHLPTLVDLIDVWPCRMADDADQERSAADNKASKSTCKDTVKLYWGDKGNNEDGTRRAGTSYTPLKPLVMSAPYL